MTAVAERIDNGADLVSDPEWRARILSQPVPALMKAYPREAETHRSIITKRGTGVSPLWRRFERFLADLGPMPAPSCELRFVYSDSFVYGPGQVVWVERTAPKVFKERPRQDSQQEYSQWATVNGQTVSVSSFVKSIGATFKEMAPVLNAGVTPDQIVEQQKAIADRFANLDGAWLPPQPERRQAFFAAYKLWHLQVLPKFAKAATPEFLFLFIALDQMITARKQLEALDLLNKPHNRAGQQREDQPAWKKYCELLPRAQSALTGIAAYASYSLFTEIDDLYVRIVDAERRFRGLPPKPFVPKSAS